MKEYIHIKKIKQERKQFQNFNTKLNMIEFINQHPTYSFIIALIFLEVISYLTWNNQDYDKWKTECKHRYLSTVFNPLMIPIYFYLLLEYYVFGK